MRIGEGIRGVWLVSGKDSDCASKSTIFDSSKFGSSTDLFVALRALVLVTEGSFADGSFADGSFADGSFAAEAFLVDTRLAGIVSFCWHLGQEACLLACLDETVIE
jgi:hypothetical protein